MSKKKKFLSGLAVLILAGGVSAVASVPSNAGESKAKAGVAQAAPDTSGNRIIVGATVSQSEINARVVDYFRAVPSNGVHKSSLNHVATKAKLAGAVKGKLNKVGHKAATGPAGSKAQADTNSTDPVGSDDQNGDNSSADPAGPDDQNGDNSSADPAGSNDQKGDTGPAGPSEDGQHGDTGSTGSDGQ